MRCRVPEPYSGLWFFWGQPYMSYLRWVTLRTATLIHPNVVLVRREHPISPDVSWAEHQDFQAGPPDRDWMPNALALPLTVIGLEELAPDIAAMQAPDVQTADLLKWWVLAKQGGTVADTDIVFLRPLPQISHDVELVVFSGHPESGYVPVSIMQGKPNPVWDDAFRIAVDSYRREAYESCGSAAIMQGPPQLARLSERVVFPWAGAYPWSRWHAWLFGSKQWPGIPRDCCGIHWYAGHNQAWNRKINGPKDLPDGAVRWAIEATGIGGDR
jgi:hypothetical protein